VTLAAQHPERDALLRLVFVRSGRAILLDAPIAQARPGSFAIAGPAAELLGPQSDGPGELVVVLGRELPSDEEVRGMALRSPAGPVDHLQVLRRAVVLEGFSHTAIDVLLGGCRAVLELPGEPPRCEVAAGARLHLWVGVPTTTAIAVAVDGRAVELSAQPRGGGSGLDLDVDLGAATGSLSVRIGDREIAVWQIAPAATFDQVRIADSALRAGKLEDASAALDAIAADAPPGQRLEVVRRRAKIARRRGELGREREWRDQAVAIARSLGRVSVESGETVAILDGLMKQHALAQAVQLLPRLDAHGTIYAEGAVDRAFYHGVLASELGELGAALGSFQRALVVAERIGDATGRSMILGSLADVLQSLGRDREALALIDAEIQRGTQDADVCARVDALTNAGWLLRDVDPRRAQQLADQAAGLAVESCRHLVPITLVNQGWLLAAARRFGDARTVLDRLARIQRDHDGRVTTWLLRLEAETVLGEDPAGAEHYAQHLAARAAELCSTELAYEAHLLRARALVLLGRHDEAASAFAQAERALTLWSRLVPLGEGRETFFQRHDQLALTAIPYFLEQVKRGRPGARLALAVTLRHSIARFVTSLEGSERVRARAGRGDMGRDRTTRQFEQTLARWPAIHGAKQHAGDAVAGVCEARDAAAVAGDAPVLGTPPLHAALFVHPAPQGLLVLAWRGSSIDFREIPRAGASEPFDQLSARIAEAAAPMLAGAGRVHLHLHRSVAALPIDRSLARTLARTLAHSPAPLRGHIDTPIAFAVDAPSRSPATPCSAARRALLVTNPQRNLWAASESARAIQGDLARIGFAVDTLEGAAASRAAIEERIADPCTALFYYDGHGLAGAEQPTPGRQPGGLARDRSDDALLLAGGDTLTAADVLVLHRVPQAVVLNGCTTAAPEGLGLAQAFLLAGAAQVIASLDLIPADDAARFTTKLFADSSPGADEIDLVRLFARATSGADLPALRVFER
jgi:tetratricopeptide (TPR) repeat protein